jgi:hypothetical protein
MFGKDEIFVGIIIFLFGAFTAFFSLKMPIGTFRMPGTGMFPLLLGILLMVLSSIFILKIFLQSKKILGKSLTSEIQGFPIRLILFFGTMVLATAFFNKLGYPLISFLLMIALLRTLGNKNWGFIFLLSLITAVISYFLFVQWLKIPLPKGWLGL